MAQMEIQMTLGHTDVERDSYLPGAARRGMDKENTEATSSAGATSTTVDRRGGCRPLRWCVLGIIEDKSFTISIINRTFAGAEIGGTKMAQQSMRIIRRNHFHHCREASGSFHQKIQFLIVSYIGYATQEIKVGNRQNIIITLQEDAKNLEEVVVTAYGTGQKKRLVW